MTLAASIFLLVVAAPAGPEAQLDKSLSSQGYDPAARLEIALETPPSIPFKIETHRCYVAALITTAGQRFGSTMTARWGTARGNATQNISTDNGVRVFDLGCTLSPRAVTLTFQSNNSNSNPAQNVIKGAGLFKLYVQKLSDEQYAKELADAKATQKDFEKMAKENEAMDKLDRERRANLTCQDCANEHAQCLRSGFTAQGCVNSFDSCVSGSNKIRAGSCVLGR